ncbi:MAG: FAD-dependent oxidoreductase [Deltaproteobacteria bacterium]|nr:FAD-dependent oxidoreductase [Deltaproteobacteria bacterium]
MSLIKTLMGRRQFMIAAGFASTCALTCKKLADYKIRAAMAADTAAAASVKAAGNRCPHLLSPLSVRNRVLKNRIMHTISPIYTLQGPENFPADAWRNHYSNIAKNAAIVTMETSFGKFPRTYHTKEENPEYWSWEHISDNSWLDIPPVWNYVERAMEDIHCEGSLILSGGNTGLGAPVPGEASGQSGKSGLQDSPLSTTGTTGMREAPKTVEDIVKDAKEKEEIGYDLYQMDSPSLEAVQAVRAATNLLIVSPLNIGMRGAMGVGSAGLPWTNTTNKPSESEIAQAVEAAKKLEGLADILMMKSGGSAGANWVTGKYEPGSSYYYAEAIKKAGVKIIVSFGGGLFDPIKNDEYIAKGITDMVVMCRALFADQELVKKVAAGRADDVTPCIQCDNCHSESMTKGPHFARCTVNPKWGAPIYKLKYIDAPLTKKKVAVIGGGPAGMKAALVAAERGHKVTMFEKDPELGGLQKYTDYTPWNWTYKVFKDYLINQVKKAGIEVRLNTKATKDMIKSAGYDTVLVATGAEVVESRMKGADAKNVFNILTCYSNKKALGKNVVFIGAGKFGTEAAISTVLDGHKVTVLAPGEEMIDPADIGAHNVGKQEKIYKNHPDFTYHMKTTVTGITGGKVAYTDEKGAEKSVQADSIVIWNGLKPRTEDAENFAGAADEVILVGDCTGNNGRIITTIRHAFCVASQV